MSGQHVGVTTSSLFATVLIAELIQLGVRDFVVCPGSRSQALALAAAEAERAGAARLHVRLDERSAAFFALGIARELGVPAPVIVTSGSAVANLFPAVTEAHEARVPFLALTADRPAELRGIRANQATRQAGLFGDFARFAIDVDVDAATATDGEHDRSRTPTELARRALAESIGRVGGRPAGPVQLNLAFRDPLSGWADDARVDFGAGPTNAFGLFNHLRDLAESALQGEGGVTQDAALIGLSKAARSRPDVEPAVDGGWKLQLEWAPEETYVHDGDALAVVIAGEGAGAEAEQFAHDAGLPLLAEVVSGSRFGREALTAYSTLIDRPEIGGLVERAIVFGHPTLTRQVPALLAREDVDVIVVDPHVGEGVEHYVPSPRARVVRAAQVAAGYDPRALRGWLGAWVVADRELRDERTTVHEPNLQAARAQGYKERSAYARQEVAVLREPITRELLVESVWRASWPHDRLCIAASRLVRVLDSMAPPRKLTVHSNRGLAGIDGTVATALGVASASQTQPDLTQAAGATRVLIGDLALLHDAGSLLWPESELRPRLQLFVGNDGGGSIFDTLEAAQSTSSELFDRTLFTPQQADLESLAEAYGWQYRKLETRGDLSRFLTEPVRGLTLVEVPLAR